MNMKTETETAGVVNSDVEDLSIEGLQMYANDDGVATDDAAYAAAMVAFAG
jgi:hypothetical protein